MSVGDAIDEAIRAAVIYVWRVEDYIPGRSVSIGSVDNLHRAVLGTMSVGDRQPIAIRVCVAVCDNVEQLTHRAVGRVAEPVGAVFENGESIVLRIWRGRGGGRNLCGWALHTVQSRPE
jgi:hypothetical protein